MKNHPDIPHVISEGFGNFLIDKIQDNRSLIDEGNLNTQQGQHAGIFGADHSGAHNDLDFWEAP